MSLSEKIANLDKQGRGSIWKRTSSPTNARTLRRGILGYLSENTKEGIDKQALAGKNHPNWLKSGVDYLTKEEQGRLKAYGFIRDDIFKRTGKFPHRMENNDLVNSSLDAWQERLQQKNIKRVAHKYVLSLNPELCEIMSMTGHCVDEMLTQSVRRVMRKYQEKYYPNERIGYLLGIHHDKQHLHAHVMLFPTTESGKLLRVSDEGKSRGTRTPFTDMRKFSEREVMRFFRQEIKNPFRASKREPSKYIQPKLVAFFSSVEAKMEAVDKNLGELELGHLHMEKYTKGLQGDQTNVRSYVDKAYESADSLHRNFALAYRKKKKSGDKTYDQFKTTVATERTNVANLLKQEYASLKQLKEDKQTSDKARRKLYNDLRHWNHYRFKMRGATDEVSSLKDKEAFEWLQKQLVGSDSLGSLVRDWVNKQESEDIRANMPYEFLQTAASGASPIAAQRFTERDRFARKCITYGSDKLKDPTLRMLEFYYRQNARLSINTQKDFVREFLKSSVAICREEQGEIQKKREGIQQRIKELRLQQKSNMFKQDLIKHVEKSEGKREPQFLEEYKHWQSMDIPTPVDALQPFAAHAQQKQPEAKLMTPDELNTRIQSALQKLRAERMEGIPVAGQGSLYRRDASSPTTNVQGVRENVFDNTLIPRAEHFLDTRRDGLQRPNLTNEQSVEARCQEVRDHYMSKDYVSSLDQDLHS